MMGRERSKSLAMATSIGCLVMAIGGCANGTARPEVPSEPVVTADGLVHTNVDLPGMLFIRDGHGIGSYDAFAIPRSTINYRRNSKRLDEEIETELVTLLEQTLVKAVHASGLPIVGKPGQCVMLVSVSLHNVEVAKDPRSPILAVMTLVMEFRDTLSGQALLRYALQEKVENRGGWGQRRKISRRFEEIVSRMDIAPAFGAAGLGDGRERPGCKGLIAQKGREAREALQRTPDP